MKPKKSATLDLVKLSCRVLDDKKAGDLRVLDVSKQSSITDYLVIATATSGPHLRAMRVELEKAIDASGVRILGMETAQESGWIVVDLFDVMIHLFTAGPRELYALENLWKDATDVSVARLLDQPKPRARKPAAKPKARAS